MMALSLLCTLLASERNDPLMREEVVTAVIGLAGALLVGAAVIYSFDKWRKRAPAGPTDADVAAELTSYREMFESGEITEAEYVELRRRVAEKVKQARLAKPEPAAEQERPVGFFASGAATLTAISPPPPPPPQPAEPPDPAPPPT
jgi:hypothetical protein